MPARPSYIKTATGCILLFAAGLGAGYRGGVGAGDDMLGEVARRAGDYAAGFAAEELGEGGGRLERIRAANNDILRVFLLRYDPVAGKADVIRDSAAPGAGALWTANLGGSPGLMRAVQTGLPAAERPNAGGSDAVILAYAPVHSGRADLTGGAAEALLGLEISANAWKSRWWTAATSYAVGAWLLLGLPAAAFLVDRRHREQQAALRNLVGAMEQSHSAVMIVGLTGRIEYVSTALCGLTGYARRELIGRPWRDFPQPEAPPDLMADMTAALRAGRPAIGEWMGRRKDGEAYPLRCAVGPVRSRDGSLACFVAVLEDRTETKGREEALQEARQRAEEADRAKGLFLAVMSHEVRTPMSAIVGFANLMLETKLAPEQRDYAQTILHSGEALIQLTNDILDFSRLESGALKLDPRPSVLRDCVEETLDLLAVQAAEKNLELLHWIEDDVPAIAVVDAARLRQVLVNLISNAVKFTPEGAVEVTVRCEAPRENVAPDEKRLAFAVRDTGVGISPERREALFKAFGPVGPHGAGRLAGAGLGLSISQNLVRLMGGEIGAVSEPGKGSTFTFTIPVASVAGFAARLPGLEGLRIALSALKAPLLGEFRRLARRWGITLVEVGSPGELDRGGWDVAFVDVDAATCAKLASGTGLPARLRTDAVYALVPVSLSGEARAKIRGYFFRLINKPVHHEGLLALLTGVRQAPAPERRPERDFGFSVLVVEDNLINQRLITRLLGMLGCRAAVADNGRVALERLTTPGAAYDLILMDLHMPELDGLGAIEKIRAGEAGPDARGLWIAVLTADARKNQRELAIAAGANDYLLKPVGIAELAESLRRFAQGR